jgi:anti-sigma factor RsiW
MTCQEAHPLLHAYVDQELDLSQSLSVETHLDGCAECASRYSRLRRLRQEIADADLSYNPPPGFERRMASRFATQSKPSWISGWRNFSMVAAVAAMLAVLVILPTQMRQPSAPDGELVDSHMRSLIAGHLVDVPSSDQHTVKPWFQGKIDLAPPVPDLTKEGFVLTGGRLDVVGQKQAAALVYTRRAHVINVYIVAGDGAPGRQSSVRGYNVISWSQSGLSYWVVSDLNAAELNRFTALLRR